MFDISNMTNTVSFISHVWTAITEASFKPDATKLPHLTRWFNMCQECFGADIVASITVEEPAAASGGKNKKGAASGKTSKSGKGATMKTKGSKGLSEAKMQPLKNAVHGKVCTRFPPEPSGYLHIGHCKALMLNWEYSRFYGGKMILRFDDTNPDKEKGEYVESFIRDIAKLKIKPDKITHSSDSFDIINDYAIKLIKEGKAFMDDTPSLQMRDERMAKIDSKYR